MILCNECGNPLNAGASVCTECGARLAVIDDAADQRAPSVHNSTTVASADREFWQSINESDLDNKLWDTIKNSNDVEKFREYLRIYPNGAFATIARDRLHKMRELSRRQFFKPS